MVCGSGKIDDLLDLRMGMRFMTSMSELQRSDFLGTPGRREYIMSCIHVSYTSKVHP